MEQVPDRAELRREYLWKKAKAYASAAGAGLLCLLILWNYVRVGILINQGEQVLLSLPIAEKLGITALLFISPVVLFLGFLSRCREELKKAAAIPYVPPAPRSEIAFPPREVLLRGAEKAPTPPEELLRPARANDNIPAEELLRAASLPSVTSATSHPAS